MRRNPRRDAEAVVVAVDHDDPANQPGRNPPAGGVAQRLLAFLVLIPDPCGFSESGAQIMRGASLQRLAVLHHRLDRIGRGGTGETLVFRLFARDDRDREVFFGVGAVHFERAQSFGHRIRLVSVRGVAFLPEKFAGAQEHAGAHFPTHDVGPLVGQQGQIAPRLDPACHRLADYRFRSGPHDQWLFQLGLRIGDQPALAVGDQAVMRDHCHFLGETVNVFGLLGKVAERDEQRKIAVFHPRRLDPRVHQVLDPFPDAVAPWPDHHAPAHP